MNVPMSTTRQFKMYLEEEVIERLEDLAERHGRRSAQQVVSEILSVYAPVWSSIEDAMRRAANYQMSLAESRFGPDGPNGAETIPAADIHITPTRGNKRKAG